MKRFGFVLIVALLLLFTAVIAAGCNRTVIDKEEYSGKYATRTGFTIP